VQAGVILRPVSIRPLPILLCLLAAGALSSCGGGGDDFSGDPELPDGYKTYRTAGISFAYPGDWEVAERTDATGAPAVEITPPDKGKTPYGLISLSISEGAGERFEELADQRRIVIRDVNDADIESDDPVDIPGAKQALHASTVTPPGRGTDPIEVRSDSLDVLRDNGDVVVLTAAAPQRDGSKFDTEAVVSSFRLGDG
jgi:hypothetical protein